MPDSIHATWTPARTAKLLPWQAPDMTTALLRGLKCECPVCGKGNIFNGYLTVVKECSACGAPLGRIRADDLPPYLTILIVGHFVVPGMLALEKSSSPPMWVHAAIWVPLTLIMTLGLLRPIKGAAVGLMLRLGLMSPEANA